MKGLTWLMAYLGLGCRCAIGLVFLVSAVSKLRSRGAFREFTAWLDSLPLPLVRRHPGVLAAALAAMEAGIVVLDPLPWTAWTARAALTAAALTLAVFTAGTWLAIIRGANQPCQCFGASATPLGRRHIVRDAVLCVIAATGALTAGSVAASGQGIAVSLFAGAVIALFVVFLDDLAALYSAPGEPLAR
ncbi:MAG: MauE/DoxX family redox-associated membrane protein [Trebonia sp.]